MNWYQAALLEAQRYYENEPQHAMEPVAVTQTALKGFDHLFQKVMRKSRIRDDWEGTQCYILPHSTEGIQTSKRLGVRFRLGISLFGWFIECPLENSDCIRNMKDDFWTHLVALSSVGDTEFSDYGRSPGWGSTRSEKKLTQHKGSLVFSIARDYVMLELADELRTEESIGCIRVTLPLDRSEEEVYQFFVDGLTPMYRINYLLHRSAYLRNKRIEKQRLKNPYT